MDEIWDIIDNLEEIEIKILKKMAKLGLSQHCNKRLETIQDQLLPKDRSHVHKNIKKLIARGLVFEYRSKNYGLTRLGLKVAHELYDKELKDLYGFDIS